MLSLTEIISYQVSLTLKEGMNGFDLRKLKTLESYEEMEEYASSKLKFLGQGSSRTVFYLSNRYVLKVARNIKGYGQNKAEVDVYTNPKSKPIVAKIYDFDDKEYSWLVSEVVKGLRNPDEFKSLTDITWNVFISHMRYKPDYINNIKASIEKDILTRQTIIDNKKRISPDYNMEYYEEIVDDLINRLDDLSNKFLLDTINLIASNELLPSDLNVLNHWGKTADNRIVLLDYGFTAEVADSYYRR